MKHASVDYTDDNRYDDGDGDNDELDIDKAATTSSKIPEKEEAFDEAAALALHMQNACDDDDM